MDQINLLDLNNFVLNITGDYVKQDNNIREFNELIKKENCAFGCGPDKECIVQAQLRCYAADGS